MKIIFIGTSSFGIPVLKKLISLKEDIIAVITQPDRRGGRGKRIQASPVKEIALAQGLYLFQPENINSENSIREIKRLQPDLIILISYGQILSGKILDIPACGCLNVHPSLLPDYKGPAPIQWTLIRGEKDTGITFLFMNEKIDAGDMILQEKVHIMPEENYQELSRRLAIKGSEMIEEALDKIRRRDYQRISQPVKKTFYARKLTKTDCQIKWDHSGEDIYNLIKGVTYFPGAFTEYKGKRIKITRALLLADASADQDLSGRKPGEIVAVSKKGIQVLAGDGTRVSIQCLILPGSKEMEVSQFINGYPIEIGDTFV